MAKTAALIVDAQRLHSHQKDDSSYLVLGLTFQLAFSEDFEETPEDANWTALWNWDTVSHIDLWFDDGAGTTHLLPNVSLWPLASTQPTTPLSFFAALDRKVQSILKQPGELRESSFLWKPSEPHKPMPSVGHIIQLQSATARLTTKLPYMLNLCAAVVVPKADIPLPGNELDPDQHLVFAVPRLKWTDAATYTPVATGPLATNSHGLNEWRYDKVVDPAYGGEAPDLNGWLSSVDLTRPASNGVFVSLETGFVFNALRHGASTGTMLDLGDDVLAKIVGRVSENWDLARHLLNSIRDFVTVPHDQYELFYNLVVTALRDRAGLGLIDTTDGEGLLKFAIQSLYPLFDEINAGGVPASHRQPTGEEELIRDGQLRSLLALLYNAEQNHANISLESWAEQIDVKLPADTAFETPSREITLNWDNGDSLVPEVGPGIGNRPTISVRVFKYRNDANPIPGAPQPVFDLNDNSNGLWYRTLLPDGSGEFRFDGYLQNQPLPIGWYQGTINDGITNPTSERVYYGGGVPQDLNVLDRLWTKLKGKETLATLIESEWARLSGKDRVVIDSDQTTPVWFSAVWTEVNAAVPDPTDPSQFVVVSRNVGEIHPLDGRTWIVSICDIAHDDWVDGEKYSVIFQSPTKNPDGTPATPEQIVVELEQVVGASNGIKVTTPSGSFTENISSTYHLRFELTRKDKTTLQVTAYLGTGEAGNVDWPASSTFEVSDANQTLANVDFRLESELNNSMNALVPSVLTSAGAPSDSMVETWYGADLGFRPGAILWQKASSNNANWDLTKLELSTRLALCQTARLVTIWHKQLPETMVEFSSYLKYHLKQQLVALWDQRLDVSGGYSNSPYRDFLPMAANANNLQTPIQEAIENQLNRVASQLSQELLREFDLGSVGQYDQQEADKYVIPIPHSLNLRVDRSAMINDSVEGSDDVDFSRRLAGFGVLLRAAGDAGDPADPASFFADQDWRLLNTADVGALKDPPYSWDDELDVGGGVTVFGVASWYPTDEILQTVVSPIQLQYQDNIRNTSITYRNSHLASNSRLDDIGASVRFGVEDDDINDFEHSLAPVTTLRPELTPNGGYDWGRIPTLRFGQLYQALCFVIGNAADLPATLVDDEHPSILRDSTIPDAEFPDDSNHPYYRNHYIRGFKYLRRVGIGEPRAQADEKSFDDGVISVNRVIAPIPDNVRPLSREWGLQALSPNEPWIRFLYDSTELSGQIINSGNWMIVLPRVMVAGQADHDDGIDIEFSISIGLTDGAGFCGARIERHGTAWIVSVNGSYQQELTHPDVDELTSGPLDFRVAFTGSQMYVAWRRSDRDELWTEWRPLDAAGDPDPVKREMAPLNPDIPAWLQINRDDDLSSDISVTFGRVEFATGCVELAGDQPAETRLSLRELGARETATMLPLPRNVGDEGEHFYIRPPSTDLETWDAWPSRPTGARRRVWGRVKLLSSLKEDQVDGSIDDLAVERLRIEVVPLRADRDVKVEVLEWQPQTPSDASRRDPLDEDDSEPNPLNPVQRLARRVEVVSYLLEDSNAIPANRLEPNGDSYKIHLLEQEIWEIRIYPLVKATYFAQSHVPKEHAFHSEFGKDIASEVGGYRAFNPWRLVVEVPTREVVSLLTVEDDDTGADDKKLARREAILIDALVPKFDGQTVSVALNKPTPRAFRYTADIRLIRQVWRWRGRPLPPFPFVAALSDINQFPAADGLPDSELESPSLPILWDAAGFGDRTPIDLLDETRGISSQRQISPLFREVLGEDRRSLYYRFAAHAASRYAGLYPGNPPIVKSSESEATNGDLDFEKRNGWRRLLVPCRREEKPSRPNVRFLVPLTQSENDNDKGSVPGILVVLDDAWFSFSGLGESLEAEVVRSSDWWDTDRGSNDDVNPVIRPEFGPDPTVHAHGWTQSGFAGVDGDDSVPHESLSMDVVGPIGHTFDTDADAPLFNASSFILRPPHTVGIPLPGQDEVLEDYKARRLDWYFAKVRFRRSLPSETMIGYSVNEPRPISELPDPIKLKGDRSDWESRSWVIDIPSVTVNRDAFGSVSFVLLDANLGKAVLEHGTESVSLRWVPQSATATSPSVELFDEPDWGHLVLSIRFVFQLESEKKIPGTNDYPCNMTVQFRLDEIWRLDDEKYSIDCHFRKGTWHALDTLSWQGSWPTNLRITSEGSAFSSTPEVYPCRNSDFTAPYWVQFLPDSNQLTNRLRQHVAKLEQETLVNNSRLTLKWRRPWGYRGITRNGDRNVNMPPADDEMGNRIRINYGDQFVLWERDDQDSPWRREEILDRMEWKLNAQNHQIDSELTDITESLSAEEHNHPKGDITSKSRVLLTELVSNVRGQLGAERYLGLFEILYHHDALGFYASECHRSSSLDSFRPDFYQDAGQRRLRIRIVEFQLVDPKDKDGNSNPSTPRLKIDVWDELFPNDERIDARARIVRVSAPVEVIESS